MKSMKTKKVLIAAMLAVLMASVVGCFYPYRYYSGYDDHRHDGYRHDNRYYGHRDYDHDRDRW